MQLCDLISLFHLSFRRDCNRAVLTFASSVGNNSLLGYRQLILVLLNKVFNVDDAAS